MNKAVHELLRALEKVQDWDGTYVGDCIEEIEKQERMKPDDYIPMRPIPISERLPKSHDSSITGPQDCDPMGLCWFGAPMVGAYDAGWIYRKLSERLSYQIVWAPWWAFPSPEVES